jgi:hypothetical protein
MARQLFLLLAGHGSRPAPGIPCTLFDSEGEIEQDPDASRAAGALRFGLKKSSSHLRPSSPAKAGDPVRRGPSAQALASPEYWIARFDTGDDSGRGCLTFESGKPQIVGARWGDRLSAQFSLQASGAK